jgi:RNA polymerase sigma-70 factor, ECF subfamily
MSDEELIQRILEGDQNCFRTLVQKYHVMVINTCFGLLHIREDAEDVAQDVFIEIYQSLNRFRQESKLSTWIYRIAVNKSINYLRKVKMRQRIRSLEHALIDDNSPGLDLPAPSSDDPSVIMDTKEKAKILHQAIESLPDNQRVAFALYKFEDLAYKEIAEVMDTSLSAVESLIHRAKINLQKKLMGYYKEK